MNMMRSTLIALAGMLLFACAIHAQRGNPAAPTTPSGDNSYRYATTAFVQQIIGAKGFTNPTRTINLDGTASNKTFTTPLRSDGAIKLNLFAQAGSQATAHNAQSTFQDVFSVKDFGAVGDGITDDTAAIQAALNYVLPLRGELNFSRGIYNITAALIIPKNANSWAIRGSGQDTILHQTANNTQIFVFQYNTLNWSIRNMNFTWSSPQSSSQTHAVAFWFTGDRVYNFNWTADHLTFGNGFRAFSVDPITSPTVWGNHIDHILFTETMSGALYNNTQAVSAGQPNTSITHVYARGDSMAPSEALITLSAVDSFSLDAIEFNIANGPFLVIKAGSSGHIGSAKLEVASYTSGRTAIVQTSDSFVNIDNLLLSTITFTGADEKFQLMAVGGVSGALHIKTLEVLALRIKAGTVYVVGSGALVTRTTTIGSIVGLVGTPGIYLTDVRSSGTSAAVQVKSWMAPTVTQVGDSDINWTAGSSPMTLVFNKALTADRTVTIQDNDTGGDSNLFDGFGPHIIRDAGVPGNFTLFIKNKSGKTIASLTGNGERKLKWYRFGWARSRSAFEPPIVKGDSPGRVSSATPEADKLPRTPINSRTTDYTLASTDNGGTVEMSCSTACTVTIPSGLPSNMRVDVVQLGASQVSLTASGTILRTAKGHRRTGGQYTQATCYQNGTSNSWVCFGNLAP